MKNRHVSTVIDVFQITCSCLLDMKKIIPGSHYFSFFALSNLLTQACLHFCTQASSENAKCTFIIRGQAPKVRRHLLCLLALLFFFRGQAPKVRRHLLCLLALLLGAKHRRCGGTYCVCWRYYSFSSSSSSSSSSAENEWQPIEPIAGKL